MNGLETGAPKGSGEEIFHSREADEKAGLLEKAADAQKRAAERARGGAESDGGAIDLTQELNSLGITDAAELARIKKEIEELPDGGLEQTS